VLDYSTLQQVAAGAVGAYQAPPNLTIFHYNADLPSSLQWNIGAQTLLPWNSSFDASWVGVYNYNTIAYGTVGTTVNQLPMDENAPDLDSHGLTLGANYTIGLRNIGNMLLPPHFDHGSDGSLQWSSVQPQLDSILHDVGTRRYALKIFGVYQLPDVHAGNKVLSTLASRWQVTGNFQAGTGVPYDATYSYNSAGPNVNITGSPSYAGRIKITGDTGSGCSGNPYQEFNTAAYSGPGYGSIGNESGSYLLHGCPDHMLNMGISRYFRLGKSETRRLQLRGDAYNVFNNVIFIAYANNMVMASPATNTTIANNQYMSDGTLNPNRLTPQTAGFGAATNAMSMRSIQLQVRLYF
jgi:hypothetical protein